MFPPACSNGRKARWRRPDFFALVLLSNALFFGSLAFTRTGVCFMTDFRPCKVRQPFWQWTWFRAWQTPAKLAFARGAVEAAIVGALAAGGRPRAARQRIRVFWRDTTQWGKTLVCSGLLGAYSSTCAILTKLTIRLGHLVSSELGPVRSISPR